MGAFGSQAFLPQGAIHLFTFNHVFTRAYGLPFDAIVIVAGTIAAIWIERTKAAKSLFIVSYSPTPIASCLMIAIKPHIDFFVWFFLTALLGIGICVQATLLPPPITLCNA